MSIKCVLFDLDGTLLDTSYDFAHALKLTCLEFDQPVLNYQDIRNTVSKGGLAMTQLAFPGFEGEALETRRQTFLAHYMDSINHHTQVFPGLNAGIELLAQKNIPWGIVTNKPTYLTEELLKNYRFASEPLSIVCGDTLTVRKPNPEPMFLAAEQCGVKPEECIYIGDHPRDIEAGINSGMKTAAAMYGYLPTEATAKDWPADFFFHTPYEVTEFIESL
ncbi:phosphoglycolate phosphatase [Thiomicrorhabdus immobilis]|uniref:Phosphoglycolate phosphatase n=1 Tax=Thiomicrorhabdus immobilis TaxID=2791037 RepID=A0ABN6CWA3_9GAMM|nr:HAD-IA family hydrolase [Thiomicrorhabdus immobilis]BCN93343.1 phosphoglycolate phosphatase [Thiomicrorhabdus immobilis]